MATRRSLIRPFFYSAAAATVLGGTALYISIRPRNIPGSDPALVPPPKYGEEGHLDPPRFPPVSGREDQIAALRRSAGVRDALTQEEWKTKRRRSWGDVFGLGGSTPDDNTLGGDRSPRKYEAEEQGRREGEPYDLLVIGGGATGSGIALDAATRGLKVALVERDDFASGTSSKSTKLVHGGVRYLEKAVWELDYNQYVFFFPFLASSLSTLLYGGLGNAECRLTNAKTGTNLSAKLCENANISSIPHHIYLCGCPL